MITDQSELSLHTEIIKDKRELKENFDRLNEHTHQLNIDFLDIKQNMRLANLFISENNLTSEFVSFMKKYKL